MSRTVTLLGIALVLSLMGNVYLGGVIAGRDLFHGPPPPGAHRPEPHSGRMGKFERNLEKLTPEGRAHVEAIWAEARPKMRGKIGKSWKSRRAVRELLQADPFDRAAYEAAQQAQDDAHQRARAVIETALADIAEGLNAADRKAYFEWTGKRRHGGRDGERERRPPDGPPPAP